MSEAVEESNVDALDADAVDADAWDADASGQSRFFSCATTGPRNLFNDSLYERKSVTMLWNMLTAVAKQQWKFKNLTETLKQTTFRSAAVRVLQVHGPPGSGKSCATYHWVEQTCRALGAEQSVTWVSCASRGTCWTVQLSNGTEIVTATPRDLPLTTDDYGDSPIVIFDGVRNETVEDWRDHANDLSRKGTFVVIVSSEGVFLHAGDATDVHPVEYFMPSWTKSEYREACRNNDFWKHNSMHVKDATGDENFERRLKLVGDKFKLAGHSARYMFKRTGNAIQRELNQKVRALGSLDTLAKAASSDRSAGAANTLVARFQVDKCGANSRPQRHNSHC